MGTDDYWVDAEKMPPACSGDYLCIVGQEYLTHGTILEYSVLRYDTDIKGWICRCKVFYWMPLPEMPKGHKDKGWSLKEYVQIKLRQIEERIGGSDGRIRE